MFRVASMAMWDRDVPRSGKMGQYLGKEGRNVVKGEESKAETGREEREEEVEDMWSDALEWPEGLWSLEVLSYYGYNDRAKNVLPQDLLPDKSTIAGHEVYSS